MVTGFARRFNMWRQGHPEVASEVQPLKGVHQLLSSILRHRRILDDRYRGIAHLFVFWGFTIPFVVVLVSQFRPSFPTWAGLGLSLLLDLVGLLGIIGTVMLLLKRVGRNNPYSSVHPIHLWILLAILITGFVAEGFRLTITKDTVEGLNALYSPVGFAFSWVVPASPVLLQVVTRVHFFLVLIFIAYIPFSNMRHVWASLFSIYYQKRRPEGTTLRI